MKRKKKYDLFRQDDNRNEFLVARFESKTKATAKMQELAKGGHKQFYEIRTALEAVRPDL